MAKPMAHHEYTFREYVELEAFSNTKHEFLDGEIYAMGGGTPTHAALPMAISAQLVPQLRGRTCRVYGSDLMIRVSATGLATYPDLSVVCGPLQADPQSDLAAINPCLVVEVLSDSSINYDRGEKLEHYRRIPSLDVVLLVWQRELRIEVHRRLSPTEWAMTTVRGGESIELEHLGASLDVDTMYADAGGVSD